MTDTSFYSHLQDHNNCRILVITDPHVPTLLLHSVLPVHNTGTSNIIPQENKARIESCSMSGEGRKVVISVIEITRGYGGWPNGLTLDYALKRIYWIDAKADSIYTSLYDGTDHREVR